MRRRACALLGKPAAELGSAASPHVGPGGFGGQWRTLRPAFSSGRAGFGLAAETALSLIHI